MQVAHIGRVMTCILRPYNHFRSRGHEPGLFVLSPQNCGGLTLRLLVINSESSLILWTQISQVDSLPSFQIGVEIKCDACYSREEGIAGEVYDMASLKLSLGTTEKTMVVTLPNNQCELTQWRFFYTILTFNSRGCMIFEEKFGGLEKVWIKVVIVLLSKQYLHTATVTENGRKLVFPCSRD